MKALGLRLAASSACVAIALVSAPASADMFGGGQSYLSLGAGVVFFDVETTGGADLDTDTGLSGDVALGWSYPSGFRFELEGGYAGADFDEGPANGDMSVLRAFVNGYYDFADTGWRSGAMTPYLGAGLGGARVDVDLGAADGDDFVLGLQGLAGLAFEISDRSSLSVGYRYLWLDDAEIDGATIEPTSHSIELRLRFGL